MRSLCEFLNESLVNESSVNPKPIHLLKNDGTYCSEKFFKSFIDSIVKECPYAVQSDNEDEYVFVTDDSAIYNILFDKYCLNNKSIEGISTRGSRNMYFGWKKYKTDKYPIYTMFRGLSDGFKGIKTKNYQK